MGKNSTRAVVYGSLIAALYVVLTFVSASMGLASGVIQVRLSECLCLLLCLIPAAVPGLTVGCMLANWLTGCAMLDVVFGSLAHPDRSCWHADHEKNTPVGMDPAGGEQCGDRSAAADACIWGDRGLVVSFADCQCR